jgi:hypothetical protein
MNNTRTLAAILIAATLVVAGTAAATTHSAFAYFPKKDNKKDGGGNDNGNTITAQICKEKASQSGFDNDQEQECGNTICTHPGSGASCVSEGAEVSPVSNQSGGGGGVCNSPVLPVLAKIDGVSICVDPSTLIKPVGGTCEVDTTAIPVTVDDTIIGCISVAPT